MKNEKTEPIRTKKAIQKSVYIKPELYEKIERYKSSNLSQNKYSTYSEIINLAIEKFFDVEATENSLKMTTEIIDKKLNAIMKKYLDRIIALQSKCTKNSYANIFLLTNFLATIYQTDDEIEFVKRKIEEADALAYKATTKYSLKNDLQNLIPNDLKF